MNLEPIIQSEVSQKEKKKKNNVCILMHIYRKMVLMKLSAVETQILRTDLWTQLGKEEGEL